MRKDKDLAIQLRKSGKSYRRIRKELKIPLSTLSDWFRDVDWSGEVRKKLTTAQNDKNAVRLKELNKIRGERLARVYEEAREEARKELETLKYNPLFISGIMLYWGEGDKVSKSHVRLTNTDPQLISLYLAFIQKVCRIPEEKIRVHLLLYPDIDTESAIRFWSFATKLPRSHFITPVVIQGRHKSKRLTYGICNIVVSSTYFKVKVNEWLKNFPQQLMEKTYYENI